MKIKEIYMGDFLHLNIQDRSSLDVVFVPYSGGFVCAVYNFDICAPIGQAADTFYTKEKLIQNGLPEPDAKSVAKAFKLFTNWADQAYAKHEVNLFDQLMQQGLKKTEAARS